MAMTQFSPGNTAGVAVFEQEWAVGGQDIFYSNAPEPVTQNFTVDATFYADMLAAATTAGVSIILPYGYVVGVSPTREIVAAVYDDPATPLLGVLAAPIINDPSNVYPTRDPAGSEGYTLPDTVEVPVFVAGYFSIAGCAFPPDFDTADKKLAANKYTSNNILFGQPAYDGIVGDPEPDLTTPPPPGPFIGVWDDSGNWTDSGFWTE